MSRSRLYRAAAGMFAALGVTAATVVAAGPATADDLVTHHEFQVNCPVSHTASDDPIVKPGQPGASHNHTFLGNTGTDAFSTTESLLAGETNCIVPADRSAYWFPTMSNAQGDVLPNFSQVIYYKSGIEDYTEVVPFPQGLRYVAGDMMATQDEFREAPGAVEGWECGNSANNWDFPADCAEGTQLNVRYQAPSCWDGVNLDLKGNMAYPVDGVCPTDHPVAVPMLEFKMAFPVDGNLDDVKLASGAGHSWHYDFFNAWDPATLEALVTHCINGGLQCNPRGFDLYKPERGGVLDENYVLPGTTVDGITGGSTKPPAPAPIEPAPGDSSTNLSQGRPATASSQEGVFAPQLAVDGDPVSRWASARTDDEWLRVDLDETSTVERVDLTWEAAYASSFAIETSTDGSTWSVAHQTVDGTGGVQSVALVGAPVAKFVRVHVLQRATGYGSSLREFTVLGTPSD